MGMREVGASAGAARDSLLNVSWFMGWVRVGEVAGDMALIAAVDWRHDACLCADHGWGG